MPSRWAHPSVTLNYSITGGYLTKPLPVETLNLSDVAGVDADIVPAASDEPNAGVFVKLDKSADWVLKAVGGTSARRGMLRRTTIVEDLKAKLTTEDLSAVADRHDDDPMAELGELETVSRKRKYVRKRKFKVVSVDMPQCEPTRHPDSKERRVIRLLGTSTSSVWIALSDVAWLLTWLSDAVSTGGVPLPTKAELNANSPAVAGVSFQWDFDDAWEAVILSGPDSGTVVRTCVSDFCEEKWAKMDAIYKYGVTFARSTYEQRKAATLHFLETHCKGMAYTHEPAGSAAP